MRQGFAVFGIASALAASAGATIVQVQINGTVDYNVIRTGSIDKTVVHSGDAVSISFRLDSTQYMNDPDGLPTRGYFIDEPSFAATYNGVTLGLESPFSAGTPMFVLRNNDPAVDGFFLSTGTAWDVPLPMNEAGLAGQLGCHFAVGYDGETLSSLNIVDAVGSYDYTGLTNFYFSTDDSGFDPMGINFDSMTISVVPAPATLALLAPLGLLRRRR